MPEENRSVSSTARAGITLWGFDARHHRLRCLQCHDHFLGNPGDFEVFPVLSIHPPNLSSPEDFKAQIQGQICCHQNWGKSGGKKASNSELKPDRWLNSSGKNSLPRTREWAEPVDEESAPAGR